MAENTAVLLKPSLYRTLFFVAVATVALVAIDGVLARTEHTETAAEAARFFADGQRLLSQGQAGAAAEAFRGAIANARDNAAYPLALGEALREAGQFDDASAILSDLLKTDSMAGAPNLAMARVLENQGRTAEAVNYYHRAIYGQWSGDAAANRVRTRFELADLLARHNSKAELLAELLPLQDEAPADASTRKKLGALYLTAGSATRAGTIFRELVRLLPQDADARDGLGNADFARADYSGAQAAYMAALRLRPDDPQATKGLDLCDRTLDLDPLRKGLGAQERYARSLRVLEALDAKKDQCLTATAGSTGADLLTKAEAALKRHAAPAAQSDAVEANLELANQLWQAERVICSSAVSDADKPLELVLAKAAQ